MTTVLIVDDSALDRELAKRILAEDLQLTVETVDNGRAALDRLNAGGIDLVLTDLMMPDINGLQLVTTIRVDHPDTPVILMTGGGTEVVAMNALAQGAASYVPKRMLNEWLLNTAHDVLALQHAQRTHGKLLECFNVVQFELELSNDGALIEPLVEYLQQIVGGMRLFDATETYRLGVGLKEALQNALYRDRTIQFAVRIDRHKARFTIRSQPEDGPVFDATAVPDVEDLDALKTTNERGFMLIRSHLDDIRFNESGTEVVLVKRCEDDGE
ncbi:MAG TPA: response regulator, partial [Pirellulaceae bacterium]|nr:response regulator [Pirellulaceae bacterium]